QRSLGRGLFGIVYGEARLTVYRKDFAVQLALGLKFDPGLTRDQVAAPHAQRTKRFAANLDVRLRLGILVQQGEATLLENQRQLGLPVRVGRRASELSLRNLDRNSGAFGLLELLVDGLDATFPCGDFSDETVVLGRDGRRDFLGQLDG